MGNIRRIVVIIIIEIIILLCWNFNVYAIEEVRGDINGDGKRTALDIAKLNSHIVNLEVLIEENLIRADLNEDGEITALDLAKLNRLLIGMGDRDVTEEELAQIREFINENKNILFSKNFDNVKEIDIKDVFRNVLDEYIGGFTENEDFSQQQLKDMYIFDQNEIYGVYLNNVQKKYKEKFNIDIDKEWIKEKISQTDNVRYIEEYDLVLIDKIKRKRPIGGMPDSVYPIYGYVEDDRYNIYLQRYAFDYIDDGYEWIDDSGNKHYGYERMVWIYNSDGKVILQKNK